MNWPQKQLSEVMRLSTERIEPRDYAGKSFNYVGLEDIESNTGRLTKREEVLGSQILSTKNVFRPNHILYGKLRPYLNKVHLATKPGICSTDILVLECSPKMILPKFGAFYLLSDFVLKAISNMMGGANLPRVDAKSLLQLNIPLPSLDEQKRVIGILDGAEKMRALRASADELTLSIAPALFQEVFGDPVNNTRGWPLSTVGEHLEMLEYGPRFYNEAYTETGTRIVRITDLEPDGTLRFDDMPKIEVDPKTLEARQLRPGDVIFARSGATVGKIALIPEDAPPCIAGAYFIRFRFSKDIDPIFGFELLRSPAIQGIIAQQSRQAAQQNFSGPLIRALPLIVPPRDTQRGFAGQIRKMRPLLVAQRKSRSQIGDMFQSLLHHAFRGKI